MCGIAGLFSFRADANPAELKNITAGMTASLQHRGPDAQGLWQDDACPRLVLGHRRLSILDLSPAGAQPMMSASGRWVCVYNGEIYNHAVLRDELIRQGQIFRGHSDTEVFLALLDRHGPEKTCSLIIGMYAVILWDRRERTLHLLRDPLGKKPLYAGWAGRDLVMGSELKALRRHPDFRQDIHPQGLAEVLHYGAVQAPATIYKKVWSIPPGGRISLRDIEPGSDLREFITYHWTPAQAEKDGRNLRHAGCRDGEAISQFTRMLETCVRERMVADVPVGAFLSGGIDSTLVTAVMQAHSHAPVKTYTIGFADSALDESQHAADIARYLGTEHHEIILNEKDALEMVPDLPHIYDEPFADISQIPACLLARFARADVKVALSGDGGDEMFGGYRRYTLAPHIWSRMKFIPYPLRRMLATGIDASLGQTPLRKMAELLRQRDADGMYDVLVASGGKKNGFVPDHLVPRAGLPSAPGLSFAERMMLADTQSYLPNDILVKVDRAAMACGLEVRSPLLDRRIAEYAWTLPLTMKLRHGKGKWLLREILKTHLPESLYERPKQGFTPPVNTWLRGALKSWGTDLVNADISILHGLLDRTAMQKTWQDYQRGRGEDGKAIWVMLSILAWAAAQERS